MGATFGKWENSLQLSGYITTAPFYKTFKNKNDIDVERATFYLYQPKTKEQEDVFRGIRCDTYSKEIIDALKSLKNKCCVVALGRVGVEKRLFKGKSVYFAQFVNILKLTIVEHLPAPLEKRVCQEDV